MQGRSEAWRRLYRALRRVSLIMSYRLGVTADELFAAIFGKIKGPDPTDGRWPLQHLRVAERPRGVVITRAPVLLHRKLREFVVLLVPLGVRRAVDELNDVIDLLIGERTDEFRLLAVVQFLRHF